MGRGVRQVAATTCRPRTSTTLGPSEALQRTIDSGAGLTRGAAWQHTLSAGTGPVSPVAAERRSAIRRHDSYRCCVTNEVDTFLSEWHRVVAAKDREALLGLLAEDVSLGAPPYYARLQGRDLVHHLLGLILHTIDGFTYHRQWQNEGELALEFTGKVGDLQLQGIDLITLNDRFVIGNLDVLIRPASAVDALRDIIAPQMASFPSRASAG